MEKNHPTPQSTHLPRRISMGGLATRGEHGLWYISGLQGQFTRNTAGEYSLYAPGDPEDGQVYAREEA